MAPLGTKPYFHTVTGKDQCAMKLLLDDTTSPSKHHNQWNVMEAGPLYVSSLLHAPIRASNDKKHQLPYLTYLG